MASLQLPKRVFIFPVKSLGEVVSGTSLHLRMIIWQRSSFFLTRFVVSSYMAASTIC